MMTWIVIALGALSWAISGLHGLINIPILQWANETLQSVGATWFLATR
jgi:hypothetical protein